MVETLVTMASFASAALRQTIEWMSRTASIASRGYSKGKGGSSKIIRLPLVLTHRTRRITARVAGMVARRKPSQMPPMVRWSYCERCCVFAVTAHCARVPLGLSSYLVWGQLVLGTLVSGNECACLCRQPASSGLIHTKDRFHRRRCTPLPT
jgi:RNase P subunit RPR2